MLLPSLLRCFAALRLTCLPGRLLTVLTLLFHRLLPSLLTLCGRLLTSLLSLRDWLLTLLRCCLPIRVVASFAKLRDVLTILPRLAATATFS